MLEHLPNGIRAPLRAVLLAQKTLLVLASLTMAVAFFLVVVIRYGFRGDLFAYEEWVLAVAFWLYFIGGAQGSWDDTHIKADFLSTFIANPSMRWLLSVLTNALELFVLGVLTWWALVMVGEDVAKYPGWPTTVAWKIPYALPRLGICVGLALMAAYSLLHLYVKLKRGAAAHQGT